VSATVENAGPATPASEQVAERAVLGEHTTAPWKIGVLSLCPARYYLSAIAKDPRRKESGFEAQVGTLLHHGIEQVAWLRTWVTLGRNEPLTPDELLRGIDQPSVKNKSIEAARRNPEALAEARVLAKKIAPHVDMAGLIIESVGTKMRPLVEEPWTLDVGEIDGKRVVVGGIWDFVRRRKGRVVITDWKKGGDLRGTDELRLDPAATLYAAAAKARWPNEHVRVEHFYLTRGTATGIDWTPEVDEWARMAALEHARAELAFTKAGSWPATPSQRACSFCNFRSTCTAFRERVTTGVALGAFDPVTLGDLEKATVARAKAREDVKLAERWLEDLDRALDPVVVRAAENGHDELVVSGNVLRRAKRSTTGFPAWRQTVRRLWELSGIAPDDIEDAVLSLSVGAVDSLLASRGWASEERERIIEVLKNETGEERSSTWLEVRAVADPTPTVDVASILELGTKIDLPPPKGEHRFKAELELAFCEICKLGEGELTSECPGVPASAFGEATYAELLDFKGGEWIKLEPKRTGSPSGGASPPQPATAPDGVQSTGTGSPGRGPGEVETPRSDPRGSAPFNTSYATCVTCQAPLRAVDPNNATGFCETHWAERVAKKNNAQGTSAGPAPAAAPATTTPSPEKSPAASETRTNEPSPTPQGVAPGAGAVVKVEPLDHASAAIANARLAENPGLEAVIVTTEKAAPPSSPACVCGKTFQNARGLAGHRRSCATVKAAAAAPPAPPVLGEGQASSAWEGKS
jgi:hypothetical protein